jgi:uncharacterized OB-fold protein
MSEPQPLSATHVLEYTYQRSVGPVLGRFFTSLRDGKIEGVKTRAGRVLVPPMEHDPETGESISDDWVEVGPVGTVTTWAWVAEPRDQHPLDHPFAFALVKLDGADTAMLHAVDAGSESAMRTGMRVRARFADAPAGGITDLTCFTPEDAV